MTLGPTDPLPHQDPWRMDPMDGIPPELLSDVELEIAKDTAVDSIRYQELTEEERKRLLERASEE